MSEGVRRWVHTLGNHAVAVSSIAVLAPTASARPDDAPPVCVSYGSNMACANIEGRLWVRDGECDGRSAYGYFTAGTTFRVDNNNGCSGADAVLNLGNAPSKIQVCENVPNASDACSAWKNTGW